VNIPDSPEELLRQHNASKHKEKECECNICKVMQVFAQQEMSLSEVVMIQSIVSGTLLQEIFALTMGAMQASDIPSAMAMSHLAGQITMIQSTALACLKTIQEIKKGTDSNLPL
jgi:hypothetical protein